MRTIRALALAAVALLPATPARADETPAKGTIVAADLFKNGLAVLRCEVTLGKPGTYVLDDVPDAVHGTFWVESGGPVEAVVKTREVDVPADEAPPANLQDDLAGKRVTVSFKGDRKPPVVGTMLKIKPPADTEGGIRGLGPVPTPFLVLQTGKGRTYIDRSEVAAVEAADAGDTVKRTRARLLLTLGKTDQAETKVTIRYLARGLAWAPSYKVDITDPKVLAIEQGAVVRNELADLAGTDVRLISGYPSVQFSNVTSPLSPHTSWAAFFGQLAGRGGPDNDVLGNTVLTQNAIAFNNPRAGGFDLALGATPAGEGVDLHYQPIGKRALGKGEALALSVAKGKADYERVVEWLVPDTRDEEGRYSGRGRGHTPGEDDSAWDALRFKNPFSFPMTTGPATVTAGGRFNGQRTTYWVNAGEETVLRVNKALSVRTRAVETEKADGGREVVWVGGRQYRRSTVAGELSIGNHRAEAVQVLLRRRFSGELVDAEGDPKKSLREEGVYSVNKRNELLWAFPLKPGGERTIKYTYTVLVPH